VFMLCALLSPFFLLRPELRLELTAQAEQETASRAQALGREAERQGVQTARLRLEKIVVSKLDELGIKPRALTIHISDDGKDSFGPRRRSCWSRRTGPTTRRSAARLRRGWAFRHIDL
jgi:hypothetical protein